MWMDDKSARLDPEALGLTGRDLELARAIAAETEALRSPPTKVMDAKGDAVTGLLGGVMIFHDNTGWPVLLTRDSALHNVGSRFGIPPLQVLDFALNKCNAAATGDALWALFWFRNWVSSALSTHTTEEVRELVKSVQDNALRSAGKTGAEKRWAANRLAKQFARDEWIANKGTKFKTKADCYRGLLGAIKERFEIEENVSLQQFRDEWLKGL